MKKIMLGKRVPGGEDARRQRGLGKRDGTRIRGASSEKHASEWVRNAFNSNVGKWTVQGKARNWPPRQLCGALRTKEGVWKRAAGNVSQTRGRLPFPHR